MSQFIIDTENLYLIDRIYVHAKHYYILYLYKNFVDIVNFFILFFNKEIG